MECRHDLMKSNVYLADATAGAGRSLLRKLSDLFEKSGGPEIFRKGEKVAVKVHFGEEGNTTYLDPAFARLLIKKLKELGADPFLTDTNTLYRGKRHKTEDHLITARRHGYTEENIGAPIIIGDEFVEVTEKGKGRGKIGISRLVWEADSLLLITHVTGHMLFGYAGALKNVSMGCAAPVGKQIMHSGLKPKVNRKKCIACGTCVEYCPVDAITLIPPNVVQDFSKTLSKTLSEVEGSTSATLSINSVEGSPAGSSTPVPVGLPFSGVPTGKELHYEKEVKARINPKLCIGCGECITVCPVEAIPILWKTDPARLAEKSAAYARAVLSNKKGKILCFNFLIDITPDCDCCDWSEPPFVPDQGILASRDILAVDQASIELIQKAPLIPGSRAVSKRINVSRKKIPSGVASQFQCFPRLKDKFKSLFGVDIDPFLEKAEKLGLGSRRYQLKQIS